MDHHNSLPSSNVAFGGLAGFSCQNDTTEPQLYYQGMSVQTLKPPCSTYLRRSNADLTSAHPIDPLSEFRVASLTRAVPDGFDELDLTVIPQSFLDEFVPWNSGDESVDDTLLTTSSSCLYNQSCFSGNEPDIGEPTLANRFNPDHHLTNLPTELANSQDSRSVAVINPLNLQQASNDNPANSAEIVDDKSSQVKRQRELQRKLHREYRKNPAFVEREKQRHREYRKNPAFIERERQRYRERSKNPAFMERERRRRRERGKNPAFAEHERQRRRERYRNNPVYAECQRVYSRIYYQMRKKFGKEEASKLASVASKRYLQSVNSREESGTLPQNSNKNLDVLPSKKTEKNRTPISSTK